MALLSPDDLRHFDEWGYVVVPNAVPKVQCDAVIAALWEFLGMNPDDPEDWYRPPLKPGGMVEIYQHQALWDNRQCPTLYQAFTELLGEEKLWVSIDRANFKPPMHPAHPEYDFQGFTHWDADTSVRPLPRRRVQGVVYLSDTAADQGGFQCVPDIYHDLDAYLARQPADRNPKHPDLTGYTVKPIPGKTGDLLIWNVLLPHGNGHNTSDRFRYAQFISMFPAPQPPHNRADDRVNQWREHRPPKNAVFPGDPREIEEKEGHTAMLTPLGRKLLGADPWE